MQIGKRPWIAFFSQSGQAIYNVKTFFNREPDAIITNRQDDAGLFGPLKDDKDAGALNWIVLPKKPAVKDYQNALKKFKDPVITLNGYLRVMPPEICEEYEIYNLHPGLITQYPELKGKDPQKRAIEAKHRHIGCVIHRVTEKVDEGEILMASAIDTAILENDEERMYDNLASMAYVMWYDFFNNFKKYEHRRDRKKRRRTISEYLRGI
jgi:folate-dependent phosphoribosylglycinamide formyltransferase PurN